MLLKINSVKPIRSWFKQCSLNNKRIMKIRNLRVDSNLKQKPIRKMFSYFDQYQGIFSNERYHNITKSH